jgi:hypothetical protein
VRACDTYGAKGEIYLKKLQTPQGKKPPGRYNAQNDG